MRKLHTILLTVILLLASASAVGQSRNISGMVMEDTENGAVPVVGAGVLVKGTGTGTTTAEDGSFSISVSNRDVLEISSLGYKTKEVNIVNRNYYEIYLEAETMMLDQLVVVGYGSMKKSDLATSVTSVNTEDMKIFPASSAAEMLRGRAAGVTVTSGSGRPGSVPSIQIRGSRSISASNTPLYVIDGSVASDTEFAMISAGDIESIEILKDAASQAIYGARASDGVILVTTKRGKAGESTVSYNGYVGVQTLHRNFDFYDTDEYLAMRREAVAHDMGVIDATGIPIVDVLADDIMADVYKKGEFVDWESLMFKKAAVYHSHELSFKGGTDKLKAMASVGYYSQDGIMKINSGYERLSARINIDYEVKKWLKLGANTSFGFSRRDIENGAYYQFITRSPLSRIYDEDGNYTPYINSNNDTNPIYSALHDIHEEKNNNYRINAFADINPFKGFTYRFNISYYSRVSENGHSRDSYYPNGGGSTASITNTTNTQTLIENSIRYDVPIRNENHKLNITAVQSVDRQLRKTLGYSTENLPVDKSYNYIANGEVTSQERRYSENNLVSFMLRAQYNLMERYLFNLAVRRDGSSRFGKGNKWGTFPSAAFAWRISQENFLKDVKWVNNLKLRVSYGIVGNQNGIDNYATLGVAKPMPGEFGDTYYMGYLPGMELPNANLKWEQSGTANVGLDFGFLDNRISGTLEYYNTRTTNLLVSRALNASLGYTSMLDNLGETRSSGVDFNANFDIIRRQDLNWSISTNFSMFRNRIVKIDDRKDENGNWVSQPGNNWIIGAPINIYYDYKADGIYQYDDFNVYSDKGSLYYELKNTFDSDGDGIADAPLSRNDVVEPGSVKLKDINKDGKINEDDRVVYKRDPDATLSISTSLSWKGFDFYMDWYAVVGGYILNPLMYDGEYGGNLRGKANGMKVDYWTPYNPTNRFPRPTFGADVPYMKTCAYQDASYVRLRTLQLGYSLPKKAVNKIRLQNLRFYITATNLLTFTKVLSYSPEVTGNLYPEPHQTVIGVNITF
ncbi:MAG: SusC/RagA family TonB-linked outer membrane protein [Candidatus Cryptobacteroides sp.]